MSEFELLIIYSHHQTAVNSHVDIFLNFENALMIMFFNLLLLNTWHVSDPRLSPYILSWLLLFSFGKGGNRDVDR